ncbi:hypothetical protein FVEG_17127 [Fusarium verticillioides 7600]|uniref:Uncharacterized protein n=1 Tax=Gibberella moniliformis (strain M3125 / FGSC 7600) TaxID=334819 RepID=W7NAJ6_GIBM7|nr:hypothetical protein FVEG_17127 [Fusarium verticillioides 7600]EWG53477.1 hypothetical protein FVEG_17127 [Fusarium verticillioides 7600]
MLVGVDLYSYTSVTHDSSITGTLQNLEVKVLTRETQRPEVNGWVRSETHRLIPPLLQYSAFTGAIQPPRPIVFPLSADHCLITLVQYNVVRALLQNMSLLSLLHHLPPGCRSSFGVSEIDTIAVKHIPSDLQATSLQRMRTPPFWINALPFPKLRYNLILMADRYDSRELLLDLGLRVYEGFNDIERCGFLVWGHPWLATSWEVSEGFVRRWGFLLKGCPEVVDSADRWRRLRGEERLVVDV